jgi:hypothetical protein
MSVSEIHPSSDEDGSSYCTDSESLSEESSSSACVSPLRPGLPESKPSNPAFHVVFTAPVSLPLLNQVEQKWNRPLDQTAVKTDFPRMLNRISIEENGEEIWIPVYKREEKSSKEKIMKAILITLAEKLQEREIISRLDQSFCVHLPEGTTDTGGLLSTCVNSIFSNLIGEDSSVTKIAKFINQGIVVPAVTILRLLFMKMKIVYKDCRGQWDVSINFQPDKVIITHKKWEETLPANFEFCWHFRIELSRDCKMIENARLLIQTIKFVNTPSHKERNSLYSALNDLYAPEPTCT